MTAARALDVDEVRAFLEQRHGASVAALETLASGFWSAAFGYRADGRDLVVRFGDMRDGFEADRLAMAYDAPDLPVPEVLEIGDAFGASYAISARHRGRFLEDVRVDEASIAGPTIVRLLVALFDAAPPAEALPPGAWRAFVLGGLVDDPAARTHGWRSTLAADARLDGTFRRAEARVEELVEACPERRDLVHGDLLHRNVLVDDDASRVTAVFSWKCSTRGDFLYDVAWCTFWSILHPGIAAADVWTRVLAEPRFASDAEALSDAASRHHCYELQIGAAHLGWHAWTGELRALQRVAEHTDELLERGPLAV